MHKSQTNAKKKGKRSITVVGKAPEQFGKKWLINVHAIRTGNSIPDGIVPDANANHGIATL